MTLHIWRRGAWKSPGIMLSALITAGNYRPNRKSWH